MVTHLLGGFTCSVFVVLVVLAAYPGQIFEQPLLGRGGCSLDAPQSFAVGNIA
jgi:hypothetical protein